MDSIDHLDLEELNEKSSYWNPSWQIWAQFDKLDISSQTMGDTYEITGVFFLSQEKHLRSYDEFILKSIWQIWEQFQVLLRSFWTSIGCAWEIFSGEISEKQSWETLILKSILANKSTVWDITENSEMWVYWGLFSQKTSLRNRRLTKRFKGDL